MREILLCKYGEIVLKGANKKYFEDILMKKCKKKGEWVILMFYKTKYG